MIEIKDKYKCCGCTACANICSRNAITMIRDNKGFLYPKIDKSKCTNCGLCEKSCPINDRMQSERKDKHPIGYALRHKDSELLKQSSSGGAFRLIADYVLRRSGVVYGAVYDSSMRVIHSRETTVEGLRRISGSKYSQSDLSNTFQNVKHDLVNGLPVLFSGTPCQVDGLKHYLRKEYDNLITVDVICHSIPSPLFFKNYLDIIREKYNEDIVNINMKDKSRGWGADCIKFFFESGKEVTNLHGIASWNQIFESGLITRESCFACYYTNLERPSDFTVGDFWDFENKRPELKSKLGTSILLLNTTKSQILFNGILNDANVWAVSENEFMQPRLKEKTLIPSHYDLFWEDYEKYGFSFIYNKYFKVSRYHALRQQITCLINIFKRI